jgi:hypothetical protein
MLGSLVNKMSHRSTMSSVAAYVCTVHTAYTMYTMYICVVYGQIYVIRRMQHVCVRCIYV